MSRHNAALLAILLALIGLQLFWYTWWSPPEIFSMRSVLILLLPPLLLVTLWQALAPGMGAVYAGLLLLGYFCKGVMEAWSAPPSLLPALLEVALTSAFYVVLYDRVKVSKKQKAQAP